MDKMKVVGRVFIFVVVVVVGFWGCKPDFKPVVVNSGFAVLSYPLYLGGDFMSGFSDGALSPGGQRNSISFLFNQQLNSVGIGAFYSQHFVSLVDGYGLRFPIDSPKFCSSFHLGYRTDCLGLTSLWPLNSLIDSASGAINSELIYYQTGAFYNVMGIPYARVVDFFDNSMGIAFGPSAYYPQIASDQSVSTMLSDALAQPFTFFLLWAGMEDVYNYALNGGTKVGVTDFGTFDLKFDVVLDNLIASSKGPHGVVANIPDLDVFPFFNYIPWNGLVLSQDTADLLNSGTSNYFHFAAGANGFNIVDSSVTPLPYRKMNAGEYLLMSVPTDSLKCKLLGSVFSIAGYYVLDQNEVNKINAAIAHYNAKIQAAATAHNIPVVDMNSFFKEIKNGYYYNGIKFNGDFIKGAFFSLDGFHPTAQGYGLLTNEFIKTINGFYHANIPLVDVTRLPGVIFP